MAAQSEHSAPGNGCNDLYRRLAEAYARGAPRARSSAHDRGRHLRALDDVALNAYEQECLQRIARFRELRGVTDLRTGQPVRPPQDLLGELEAIHREDQRRAFARALNKSAAEFEPAGPLLVDLVQDEGEIALVEWRLRELLDTRGELRRNLQTLLQEADGKDLEALLLQLMEAFCLARGVELPRLVNDLFVVINSEYRDRSASDERRGTPEFRTRQIESARAWLGELGLLLPETSSPTPRIDTAAAGEAPPLPETEPRYRYDLASLTEAALRELVLEIGKETGYPPVPFRERIMAKRGSWRQFVRLRAERADLEDLVSRFPPRVVEPLLAPPPSPQKPSLDDAVIQAKDAFHRRGIESYSAGDLDDLLRPVIASHAASYPGRAVEQTQIAELLGVERAALSRAVSGRLHGWPAYVQQVLRESH